MNEELKSAKILQDVNEKNRDTGAQVKGAGSDTTAWLRRIQLSQEDDLDGTHLTKSIGTVSWSYGPE